MKRTRDTFADGLGLDFGEFDDPTDARRRWITILRHLTSSFIPELADLTDSLPDIATIQVRPLRSWSDAEYFYGIIEQVSEVYTRASNWEDRYLSKALRNLSEKDCARLKMHYIRPRVDESLMPSRDISRAARKRLRDFEADYRSPSAETPEEAAVKIAGDDRFRPIDELLKVR